MMPVTSDATGLDLSDARPVALARAYGRSFAKSTDASRIIRFLQEIFARKPDGPFAALVDGPFPALVECHGRAWYLSDRTTKPRLRNHAMATHGIVCQCVI
jgi:hypothetical protein